MAVNYAPLARLLDTRTLAHALLQSVTIPHCRITRYSHCLHGHTHLVSLYGYTRILNIDTFQLDVLRIIQILFKILKDVPTKQTISFDI